MRRLPVSIVEELSCKPESWKEVVSLELTSEHSDLLAKLPRFTPSDLYGTTLNNVLPTTSFKTVPVQTIFVLLVNSGTRYLVDTQGYDYARYVALVK